MAPRIRDGFDRAGGRGIGKGEGDFDRRGGGPRRKPVLRVRKSNRQNWLATASGRKKPVGDGGARSAPSTRRSSDARFRVSWSWEEIALTAESEMVDDSLGDFSDAAEAFD